MKLKLDAKLLKTASGYSRLMRVLKGNVPTIFTFGIIAADNPQGQTLTPEENNKLQQDMRDALKNQFGYIQHRGHYGAFEKPFFIMNIAKKTLIELAQSFNQRAVIFGTVDHENLTVHSEWIEDQITMGTCDTALSDVPGKQPFYSEYKGRKFYIPFLEDENGSSVIASNLPNPTPSLMSEEVSNKPLNASHLLTLSSKEASLKAYATGNLVGLSIMSALCGTLQALQRIEVNE